MADNVVLVRHGETEWSRDGRHTGRTDLPLTAKGERQAEGLAAPLRSWQFALVLSSPLQRALETCRLAGYGAKAQLRPELVEWDYGRYEGLTSRQIAEQNPGWSLWRDGGPDGETPADVGRRVDRVIAEVRQVAGDVLVFAHGHVLRVLTARWLEMAVAAGARFYLAAGARSTLGFERDTHVIREWNLT